MLVVPVPCLSDNYAYLVTGTAPGRCLVVDPSEAGPVLSALSERGLSPEAVLCTHHHFDHVGGVVELAKAFPGVAVVAHERDRGRIEGLTREVRHGERFAGVGLAIEARHIPGHTMGAVAYVLTGGGGPGAVFTGDTLFVAGCGRLFEGTPEDMYRSLCVTLADLPDPTEVYCGHEYTEANLRFAAHVEPENPAIAARVAWAAARRKQGLPTVPSTMGDERATNPFVRSNEPDVARFAGLAPGARGEEVLGAVRRAKDNFGVGAQAGKRL